MKPTSGKLLPIILFAGLYLAIGSGCDQAVFKNDLEAIRTRGTVRVIMRNNGNCYYEGAHGSEGFEYELVKAFARHLGVSPEILVRDNEAEMVTDLIEDDVDLIAANFIAADDLRQHLTYGPEYGNIQLMVVGKKNGPRPKTVSDLVGQPIWVMAGGFHEKRLNTLRQENPQLSWMSISDYESEELLEMVWKGVIPLTVADSNTLALNRKHYPDLVIHFAMDQNQQFAWVIHPRKKHLRKAVDRWFNEASTQSLLESLTQHYYGHLDEVAYLDILAFRKRVRSRLPKYRKHFKIAAEKYNLDWKLIAAQAYQESHWNPRAKSFTGVRGLMMLTLDTARDMGIKNRLDPQQSIYGGTRYLAKLHGRIDDEVPEPDRTFMALAAYNVGLGHLEDAQTLAVKLGKDPTSWSTVRSTLPLLRLKKYYKKLPRGYARGAEPVQYVDRIRTYQKILTRWEMTNDSG
jgi:membrane-bound lytic murein transglycosylase F